MRRSGFSLVELVMVTAVVAIVGAIAAPRVAGALARQRADATARRIVADIAYAQRDARKASAARSIDFDATTGTYQLNGVDHPDKPGTTYSVDLSNDPYTAVMFSADFDSATTLSFDGFGKPNAGGTVVVGVGDNCRTVQVDAATGRATSTTTTCPANRTVVKLDVDDVTLDPL